MILFWTIYLLGVIATMLLLYYSLEHGTKITVAEIAFALLVSTFSWMTFIIVLIVIFADYKVFTKKQNYG